MKRVFKGVHVFFVLRMNESAHMQLRYILDIPFWHVCLEVSQGGLNTKTPTFAQDRPPLEIIHRWYRCNASNSLWMLIFWLGSFKSGWWFGTWILFFQMGMSSSQLTNSIIFRGVGQPPTRNRQWACWMDTTKQRWTFFWGLSSRAPMPQWWMTVCGEETSWDETKCRNWWQLMERRRKWCKLVDTFDSCACGSETWWNMSCSEIEVCFFFHLTRNWLLLYNYCCQYYILLPILYYSVSQNNWPEWMEALLYFAWSILCTGRFWAIDNMEWLTLAITKVDNRSIDDPSHSSVNPLRNPHDSTQQKSPVNFLNGLQWLQCTTKAAFEVHKLA